MSLPTADVVLGGRYRLVEARARGGMGTVWEAQDETLGRRVAVKVLNEGLADDPKFIERFRREARAAAGLSHPNVAGVFDYGEDGSRPYIVMELVEGETLAARLDRDGPLPAAEAARVGAEIADALGEAHAAQVVHRDVKPANVMLTPRGVKVMDFGIASAGFASNLTATGMVMGTARYLSPEQARGDRATPASDVYGLGVVLYEALTGAVPFERDTPLATAAAHVNDPPRPLREVRPDVGPDLGSIIDAMLSKEADRRPGPASELAAALRAASAAPTAAAEPALTVALDTSPTAVLPASEQARPVRRSSPGAGGLPAWLIPVAFVLLGLGLFFLIARLTADPPAPPVTVPDFSDMGRLAAEREAERLGIDVEILEGESDAPRGRIFDQTPGPGTTYEPGSTVVLMLSTGPALVAVPSLDGAESREDVEQRLEAAGLVFAGFIPVEGETGIVGTDPPEGAEVEPGTPVSVLAGTGEDKGKDEGKGKGEDKDEGKDDD